MVVRRFRSCLNQVRLIGLVGFEPTASSSRTRRSTKLSHSPRYAAAPAAACGNYFAYLIKDGKDGLISRQNCDGYGAIQRS